MSWDMFSQSEESTFLVMVKINLTAACSWADIGSLLFFFYLSILKRSMVPCFGLPQKRGDSLNNRFKTDTSHFSSFALNFSFQRVQTCYRERDFRKQVEDCGEERCLRSIGTPFSLCIHNIAYLLFSRGSIQVGGYCFNITKRRSKWNFASCFSRLRNTISFRGEYQITSVIRIS